jgi:ABC-type branched-subunit amino acid transport system substrate-binding protein
MVEARTRRFRWATLAGLGIGIGLGCTPTLDFLQCRNDDDCRNVAMVDLVCVSNTCVAPPDPLDSPCESNQECVDRFDEDHICGANSFCASLSTELCPKFVRPDDVDPDEIVWLGSILAVSPPFDEAIGPIENAVQLAVEDFDSVASLAGGKKVGWVGCDSQGDSEQAVEAARYLVDSIGVPAIVGPAFSGEMIDVVEEVTVEAKVFVISPTATAKSITTLDDKGLAWRTISSDVYQAAALADRMALLDPPPNRILVLAKQDLYGQQLLEDTSARLATALPTAAVGTLFYPDPAGFESENELLSAYGQVIATGFEQNADAVLIIGTSEVRELILSYLLALDGMQVSSYPTFVVSHGAVPVLSSVVDRVADPFKPVLMGLLEGVSPQVQEPTTFDQFNIRYRIRFSDLQPLSASALGYDAAMVALLAMASAGDAANDGVEIARAVPKLADASGTPIPFLNGLDFIVAAVNELEAGNAIDITGVSGPLDFDLVAGEVRSDLLGWDVIPRPGSTAVPTLSAARIYVLDPDEPSGEWMDL